MITAPGKYKISMEEYHANPCPQVEEMAKKEEEGNG